MKISYSQVNLYSECSQHHYLKYKQKIEPIQSKGSLWFGNAVEAGVNALLENKSNYLEITRLNWMSQTKFGKTTAIYDNPEISFAHTDFDKDILTTSDKEQMLSWMQQSNLDAGDPVEAYKKVAAAKKNPYKKTQDNELVYFNRCSWLSLARKAEILVESFKEQFLPKITKVHALQINGKIGGEGGDSIEGYIDFVLEIEGYDQPIIFDLKTAAQPYDDDKLELTEQLLLYMGMVGEKYNTDKVGYIVLCKNINKERIAYCSVCHAKRLGKHKTCNETIANKRCNGAWDEKLEIKPVVQVLVTSKSQNQLNDLLKDYEAVVDAMKHGIVYKVRSKCANWYGSKCCFYDLCHKGSMDGLKQR